MHLIIRRRVYRSLYPTIRITAVNNKYIWFMFEMDIVAGNNIEMKMTIKDYLNNFNK